MIERPMINSVPGQDPHLATDAEYEEYLRRRADADTMMHDQAVVSPEEVLAAMERAYRTGVNEA